MFNLPILQSGSGWNARWNTGAWPSPWALSLAFLGGAAAVTWFCKTHLIGVFWGITHPKWYEHVDKEVNHIRSCNLSSWIVYWWSLMWIWRCNYIIVYIYICMCMMMIILGWLEMVFSKRCLQTRCFISSLYHLSRSVSSLLLIPIGKKRTFTRVILAAIHEELHWNYSLTLHKSISCHHQTLLGKYWMAVSGIRCLVKLVVAGHFSSTKIDVLGILS